MTNKQVSDLLNELEFYLKMYPTYKAYHANMKEVDRMIATIIRQLKHRGADSPDENEV